MTRKEYLRYARIFGISLLVIIPVLIALNLLIGAYVSPVARIFLNVALVLAGYLIALYISKKHTERIAHKRQEFLANKQNETNPNVVAEAEAVPPTQPTNKKHHKCKKGR